MYKEIYGKILSGGSHKISERRFNRRMRGWNKKILNFEIGFGKFIFALMRRQRKQSLCVNSGSERVSQETAAQF